MNPNFCQKTCTLNRDAYLNRCVPKREIIVHTQQAQVLPPIIIIVGILDTIHTTPKASQTLKIPTQKNHKFMDTFSKISIRYLMHIILNKRKLKKKLSPIPLD